MAAPTEIDQVRIDHLDERVRCGPALFTPFLRELEVRFLDRGVEAEIAKYDLQSVPFNTACLLHDPQGRPTSYLVCNQWGTLHVRYGPVPPGTRYPALVVRRAPRHAQIGDELLRMPRLSSSALHPNPRIPLLVKIFRDQVAIELLEGGLTAYHFDVPLRSVPRGRWYTPCDKHRRALPVRLRRPMLAALMGLRTVEIEWVG
jgi:hypothetical protein